MKKRLNQQGSLPLVLLIVFAMTMSALALTTLYINDKINLSRSITKDIERVYKEDGAVEMTLHVLQQVIQTKKFNDADNQDAFNGSDWQVVEEILNQKIFPYYGLNDVHVYLENTYLPPAMHHYCQTLYVDDAKSVQRQECLNEPFSIELMIHLRDKTQYSGYSLKIDNLFFTASEEEQFILINSNNSIYQLKKE